MRKKNDGGPAFPVTAKKARRLQSGEKIETIDVTGGLTVRDYIAIEAMAAMLQGVKDPDRLGISVQAFAQADAMLTVRGS